MRLASLAGASLLVAAGFAGGAWWARAGAGTGGVEAPVAAARKVLYWHDPMHPAYHSDRPGTAPDCGMDLEPVYEGGGAAAEVSRDAITVSSGQQQLIGLRTGVVQRAGGSHLIRTIGHVASDEGSVYSVSAGVDGRIHAATRLSVGRQVRSGEWLATLDSRDVLAPQQAWLYALDALARVEGDAAAAATGQLSELRAQARQAEATVAALGMGEAQRRVVAKRHLAARQILLVAPAGGQVVARGVSTGQQVSRGAELFRIADARRPWVAVELFERDRARVVAGQRARLSGRGLPAPIAAQAAPGAPRFDASARLYRARFELATASGALQPDEILDVEIPIEVPETLSVPAEAVIDTGLARTVFVDLGEGHFAPRTVEIGARFRDGSGDRVAIVSGLAEGDHIVVSGHFLLDAESRMQAAAAPAPSRQRDPTCGMEISDVARAAGHSDHQGVRYFFCSAGCKRRFDAAPSSFAAAARPTGSGPGGVVVGAP